VSGIGTEKINPRRNIPANPIAFVNPHLPAGDVVEVEPLGLMPGKGGKGGEGIGEDRKT
jgi:hypothetical protein